jgi:hypothetical protein
MKIIKHEILINHNENLNIQSVEDYIQGEDLNIWDLTRIYDSDRISGATDKSTTTGAHGIGTPEIYLGKGP